MRPPSPHSPTAQADARAALEARREQFPAPTRTPRKLPLASLSALPTVFQPRVAEDADNIEEMVRFLRGSKGTPLKGPLLVVWAPTREGAPAYAVVDGHHRLKAYQRAEWPEPIEVKVLCTDGASVAEAVEAALEENVRKKANMGDEDRAEQTWRAVLAGGRTVAQVALALGVHENTVKAARKTLKQFSERFPHEDPAGLPLVAARKRLRYREQGDYTQEMAERDFNKRVEGIKEALAKTGFNHARHCAALCQALSDIAPDLPERLWMHAQGDAEAADREYAGAGYRTGEGGEEEEA